jgi:hypothetical protein
MALVELSQSLELFQKLVGDGLDGATLERDKRAVFSSFHHFRRSKDTSVYYVEKERESDVTAYT